ncbi:hypothetical protein ACP70R_022623 [Stipagrostis hirtigluma subsp. patula]
MEVFNMDLYTTEVILQFDGQELFRTYKSVFPWKSDHN